ncbi:MAG: nucleoside triphosphate pyrophosphohydrolase [Clostridia bacterium]|jgi:tetrapyrrole methylase family protein/MazG family protein
MKNRIIIVGLGPGTEEHLTLGSIRALEEADRLILKTEHHGIISYLRDKNISFTSLDFLFEQAKDFDDLNRKLADYLISRLKEDGQIVYGVPGHGVLGDASVEQLLKRIREEGIAYTVIPCISRLDCIFSQLEEGTTGNLRIYPAGEREELHPDPRVALVILELANAIRAAEIKLKLMEAYPAEHPVLLFRTGEKEPEGVFSTVPLYQLDRLETYDHNLSVFLPPASFERLERFDFGHLVEIMARLRGPQGCPWDKEQTHESLKQYLIEEAYEVLEAIDEKDVDKLISELGDVLFQVIFHSQVAEERGDFHIGDVLTAVCQKMIDRHPHIFGNAQLSTEGDLISNWEAIKKEEKGLQSHTQVLKDIPSNLPALMRSYKVQQKAALVGFDWDNVHDAFKKVTEEVDELRAELEKMGDGSHPSASAVDELGDVLFAVVNIARFLEAQPELVLTATTEKFIRRFQHMEEKARQEGRELTEMKLEEMDQLWDEAKNLENAKTFE